MAFKIEHEPSDFRHLPAEVCVFCRVQTRWWRRDRNTPVCQPCAYSHTLVQLDEMPGVVRRKNARAANKIAVAVA